VNDPLNEILTSSSTLMEEYIGHDDMRHRLEGIIDNITKIKTALKDICSGPKGILGVRGAAPTEEMADLAGRQVLIVDDEQFIRQTISDVLQKYGCITDTVRDGRQAITLLGQKRYDLVISDIKLPHASGYEVFAAARSGDNACPVILMTGFGYDPNHSIVRANREGLSAVLYKPFKVDQLMSEVCRAAGIKR